MPITDNVTSSRPESPVIAGGDAEARFNEQNNVPEVNIFPQEEVNLFDPYDAQAIAAVFNVSLVPEESLQGIVPIVTQRTIRITQNNKLRTLVDTMLTFDEIQNEIFDPRLLKVFDHYVINATDFNTTMSALRFDSRIHELPNDTLPDPIEALLVSVLFDITLRLLHDIDILTPYTLEITRYKPYIQTVAEICGASTIMNLLPAHVCLFFYDYVDREVAKSYYGGG